MFCSNCGKEISDDSLFCPECGNRVERESEQVSFCPNCGSKLERNTGFCSECGTRIQDASESTVMEEAGISAMVAAGEVEIQTQVKAETGSEAQAQVNAKSGSEGSDNEEKNGNRSKNSVGSSTDHKIENNAGNNIDGNTENKDTGSGTGNNTENIVNTGNKENIVNTENTGNKENIANTENTGNKENIANTENTGNKEKKKGKKKERKEKKEKKKPKENAKLAIPITIAVCLAIALLGLGGYGIYNSIVERNAAETSRLNAEREKDEALLKEKKEQARKEAEEAEKASIEAERLAKEKAEQEELNKQKSEAREKAKKELLENIKATFDKVSNFDYDNADLTQLSQLLSYLKQQKEEYKKLEKMEDNLSKAGDHYYALLEDALSFEVRNEQAYEDIYQLCLDLDEYIAIDPIDSFSLDSYMDDCEKWLSVIEEDYNAVEIPSFYQAWYRQVGNQISLLDALLERGAEALYYEDVLRYDSFLCLNDHITQKIYQKISEYVLIYEEADELYGQKTRDAIKLYDELMAAGDLPYEQREKYAFSKFEGELITNYDTIDVIYPTLYNAIDQFAILELGCILGERDVIVEFEIPGLTQVHRQSYHIGQEMSTIYLKPPATTNKADFSSVKDGQMRIVISEKDGTVIESHSAPVRIMSQYDFRWINDEFGYVSMNNILCFLTPEASAITRLKREAINVISDLTGERMSSFPGYQNTYGAGQGNEYINTYLQAAGIMIALSEMNVRYNMDPFSSSGTSQHIMLPEEVLEYKSGLCIETSLVVASALQSAGLHTYLVLPDGHAQVAVEVWEGTGEYFLIETTMLPNDRSKIVEYINALLADKVSGEDGMKYIYSGYPVVWLSGSAWEDYILENNVTLIDCSDSSLLGATPFAR